ncbi:hypothetical protein ES707_11094 [subsurface metagenome]
MKKESAGHHTVITILKYHEDIEPYRGREYEFHRLFSPYEVVRREINVLLNTGIAEMWDLIIGGSANHFTNAVSQLGVGDSSTAAAAGQTDLQAATNKQYNAMEATFPSRLDQTLSFKSSFGDAEANYAWEEWVVKQSTSGICLNRKAESLGTKASGTWTLEVAITLS